MGYITETTRGFTGEFSFLSPFSTEYPVTIDGVTFRSREAAFQALRISVPGKHTPFSIRYCPLASQFAAMTPMEAYTEGSRRPARRDWPRIQITAMGLVLYRALQQNPEFQERLTATGQTNLVYYNDHGDTFWGICHNVGENVLGELLMRLRKFTVERS